VKPPGLAIGQLAQQAGVTVRAVRHYHRCGLLPEPERDSSGYRRYGAQAVVDLIRIKTLADAGVPLARIRTLLAADPERFRAAVAEIDAGLRRKVRELTRQRERIAALTGGDRLFLPVEVVDLLDELRALGMSERGLRMERDGWILVVALSPRLVPEWVAQKRAALADPEFRRLSLAYDEAFDWDPADPRLADLAGRTVAWFARRPADHGQPPPDLPAAVVVMAADITNASPAWRRVGELTRDRLDAARG
jgi:DNA-binding transcriptional MerR regulator